MHNTEIECRPLIKAGSTEDEINILCINSNGFPSNRYHGIKMYYLNLLIKENDVAIILETGINKNCRIKELTEDHDVTKINAMKETEKE